MPPKMTPIKSKYYNGLDNLPKDSTIHFIDIEINSSIFMWEKRKVLDYRHARALYDLGLHETLSIIERYGYDWSNRFKTDNLLWAMGQSRSITLNSSCGNMVSLIANTAPEDETVLTVEKIREMTDYISGALIKGFTIPAKFLKDA